MKSHGSAWIAGPTSKDVLLVELYSGVSMRLFLFPVINSILYEDGTTNITDPTMTTVNNMMIFN